MTRVAQTIAARARVEASISDPARDPENISIVPGVAEVALKCDWLIKEGYERITAFLEQCLKSEIDERYQPKYPHIFTFGRRYKFITVDNKLDRNGKALLLARAHIDGAIKEVLTGFEEEELSWIKHPEICNGVTYLFPHSQQNSDTYQHALFLYECGLIDHPENWIINSDQIICRVTDFGVRVYKYTIETDTGLLTEGDDPDYQRTQTRGGVTYNHTEITMIDDHSTHVAEGNQGAVSGGEGTQAENTRRVI